MSEQTDLAPRAPTSVFLLACMHGTLPGSDAAAFCKDLDASTKKLGLQQAAKRGHCDTVRFLLELEPSIEVDVPTAGCAARGGLPIYQLFHSKYPDMVSWDFGLVGSVVDTAARLGDIELLQYVLENGGDPGRTPECLRFAHVFTPIDSCALTDKKEAAEMLVKYGATLKDTQALIIAVTGGQLGMVRCLLDLGADVNGWIDPAWRARNWGGPLQNAVHSGQIDMIQLLLARGADPHLKDGKEVTAIDVALSIGDVGILDLLTGKATDSCRE